MKKTIVKTYSHPRNEIWNGEGLLSQSHSLEFRVSIDPSPVRLSPDWFVNVVKLLPGHPERVFPSGARVEVPEISRRFRARQDAEDYFDSIQDESFIHRNRFIPG